MPFIVIVESPSKIKTISKYLNDDYIVMASVGHIMDLKQNDMSVNLETFEPEYEEYKDKKDIIKKLRDQIKNNKDKVILASDMDREGEMISWSIMEIFKLKNPSRIVFSSITKTEINKALQNPGKINKNLVYAQQARRILDRFAGYCISPILSKLCEGAKSAGRVQSVIVKLLVDKEKDIEKFNDTKQSTYYYINVNILIDEHKLITKLVSKNDKSDTETEDSKVKNTFSKDDEKLVIKMMKKIAKSELTLLKLTNKIKNSNPQDPFTTSTLQQSASVRLKYNSKTTMTLAQKLYESGHITYMRTDSIVICDEAIKEIEKVVLEKFGDKYYQKRLYENNKNSQEAHECIRPTKIYKDFIENISTEEQKLYYMIWKQTIQSQMACAINQLIKLEINISKLEDYKLVGKLEILIFEGYLILDNKKPDKELNHEELKNKKIDYIDIQGIEDIKKQPERYNEASLIKKLDPKNLNIGRPSTYANLLNTVVDRNYVEIKDIDGYKLSVCKFTIKRDNPDEIIKEDKNISVGKENKKYIATPLGIKTVDFLEKYFNKIMDYHFTAEMEEKLDQIAEGKINKLQVIKPFYDYIQDCIKELNIQPTIHSNSIGKLKNIDVLLASGKFGKYIIYNNKNYSVQELFNDKEPSNNQLIEYLDSKLDIVSNEWTINKKTYKLKNGQYGYYVEEWTNKKIRNIPIKFLIDKLKNEETVKNITNDMLEKYIENYDNYKNKS